MDGAAAKACSASLGAVSGRQQALVWFGAPVDPDALGTPTTV